MAIKTKHTIDELRTAAMRTTPIAGDITIMQKVLTFAGDKLFDKKGNFVPINWWNVVKLLQIAKFIVDLIRWIIEVSKKNK